MHKQRQRTEEAKATRRTDGKRLKPQETLLQNCARYQGNHPPFTHNHPPFTHNHPPRLLSHRHRHHCLEQMRRVNCQGTSCHQAKAAILRSIVMLN